MEQVLRIEILSAVLEKVITSLPTPQEFQEAKYQGATAGTLLLGASLNPHPHGGQLNRVWDTERLNATARRLYSKVR